MKVLLTALLLLLPAFSSFAQVEEDEPDQVEFVEVDVEPEPITPLHSLVVYPEAAKRAGKEGQVIISALIDETGNVLKVQIEKSSDPIFDEAAKQALLAAKFKPALYEGEGIKLWYTVPITFKLLPELSAEESNDTIGGIPPDAQLMFALDSMEQLVRASKETPEIFLTKARHYGRADKLIHAEQAYKRFVAFDSSDAQALMEYGTLIARNSKDFVAGLAQMQRAYKLEPENPMVLTFLGLFLFSVHLHPDTEGVTLARKHLQRAVDIFRESGADEQMKYAQSIIDQIDRTKRRLDRE